MSLFPTIITKEIIGRGVTLTSFRGMIITIVQEGRTGVAECTALALEEECDDLVGATIGG
jgi:hypothetical protein